MAITLTAAFLAELKKNVNAPNTVVEITLSGGTKKWGFSAAGFSDVTPCLKSVSSLQNKIDAKAGYTTRGQITLVITGRDNFKTLVRDEYLKNRRVVVKQGFTATGFAYSDYAAVFTGVVLEWTRRGDELSVTVADDLKECSKSLPVENDTKTQTLKFQNMNPADIMTNILLTQLGIGAGYVDSAKFASERDAWLALWKFDRVLTDPQEANKLLNELQQESNSFIVHDGEKVSFKVFAPVAPGAVTEEWTDAANILEGTVVCKSGYRDAFFNRVVVYYDYMEGGDGVGDYDSAVIRVDAASQAAGQWGEAATKVIKSKWIKSYTFNQPVNVTGVTIYALSTANGLGAGTLTWNFADKTLQWTPPGGSIGAAVICSKPGKYAVYGADTTKYIRVVVASGTPGANQTDTITTSAANGATLADLLANKYLSRFRDPATGVSFAVDINNVAYGGVFAKPTDIKDLTTDEALEKGDNTWVKERLMLTSVRPDFAAGRVEIEAIETRMYLRYGFVAPAGYPNYPSASAAQREYAFIGDSSNKVNGGTEDGYHIW